MGNPKGFPALTAFRTGHTLVDGITQLHFEGIWIAFSWLGHPELCNEKGKPNIVALIVYGDIVDWYRPVPIRNPTNDQIIAYRKKFDGEVLEQIREAWAKRLGLTYDQLQNALEFLRDKGLVKYENLTARRNNQKPVKIWPVVEKLREITFPDQRRRQRDIRLQGSISSGNDIVNAVALIAIDGLLLDYRWFGHSLLCNEEGKFQVNALVVYADVIEWHRATLIRDETTNKVIAARKKFDLDKFYKDYEQWAEALGLTDRQLRKAVAIMVKSGLFAPVSTEPIIARTGRIIYNMPQFAPILDKVIQSVTGISAASKVVGKKRDTPLSNPDDHDFFLASDRQKTRGVEGEIGEGSSVKNASHVQTSQVQNSVQQHPLPSSNGTSNADAVDFNANALNGESPSNSVTQPTTPQKSAAPAQSAAAPWTPQRRAALIQKVLDLDTGCEYDAIERAVNKQPDYVQDIFLVEWEHDPVSDALYWAAREARGLPWAMGGAARKRLLNPKYPWPRLVKERRMAEIKAAEKQRAREADETLRQQQQQKQEARELENKLARQQAGEGLARYHALPAHRKEKVFQDFRRHNAQFNRLAEIDLHDYLAQINEQSPTFIPVGQALAEAIGRVDQQAPPIPSMNQFAAGEDNPAIDRPSPVSPVEQTYQLLPESERQEIDNRVRAKMTLLGLPVRVGSPAWVGLRNSEMIALSNSANGSTVNDEDLEETIPTVTEKEIFERNINRLVLEIQSGTLELDEIDSRQGLFEADEWMHITAEVQRRVAEGGN